MFFLGIDPGQQGGFVCLSDKGSPRLTEEMPLISKTDKNIDFERVQKILSLIPDNTQIYLERALALAMGSTHAFNYGRGFAALEIAIKLRGLPVTYVHPSKWTRVIHEGTNAKFQPKDRSVVAFQRLFPKNWDLIPKSPRSKKPHMGILEAWLLAEFGRRTFRDPGF